MSLLKDHGNQSEGGTNEPYQSLSDGAVQLLGMGGRLRRLRWLGWLPSSSPLLLPSPVLLAQLLLVGPG